MPLELSCPYCSKAMKLADSSAGLVVRCPRCNNRLKIGVGENGYTQFDDAFKVVEDVPCPCCRSALSMGATTCAVCGYDTQTRRRPSSQRRSGDEVEIVGSPFLGTYTEFVFRRDPFDDWVLMIDTREQSQSTSYIRLVLREYAEARINYFQVAADSGSMNVDVIDHSRRRFRIYAGDSSPMEWLIARLQTAGLEIKRI